MASKEKPEKIDIARISVKYEDVFNLKELYKYIRQKIRQYGWIDDEKEKWMEKYYLEKHTGVREVWLFWRLDRIPDNHPFIKYYMNIDYHVLNMKDTEIVHEGKKLKANKGEVEVTLTSWIELDYKNEWSKPPFRNIYGWFKQRFYKDIIDFRRNELYKETYDLQGAIKQYLDLRVLTEEELFYPAKGLS